MFPVWFIKKAWAACGETRVTVLQFLSWISNRDRAFFFSPETISKVDDIKIIKGRDIKGKSVLFCFLYPFIFLSLPSFLHFLPFYMAWRRPKSLVKSRRNNGVVVEFFNTIFISPDINVYTIRLRIIRYQSILTSQKVRSDWIAMLFVFFVLVFLKDTAKRDQLFSK